MRSAVIAVAVSLLLLVIGWGITGSVSAQEPGCLPTSARTIGPHGFPGLGVKRLAAVHTDPLQLALSEGYRDGAAQHEATVLRSGGFVSGTSQFYFGKKRKTRGDAARADTEQFGSPEQAQAEFNRVAAQVERVFPWKHFTVPAIPGSVGFRQPPSRRFGGASNLYFAEGDYFYFVGKFVLRGGSGTRHVANAAVSLYNRVHGAPVCL